MTLVSHFSHRMPVRRAKVVTIATAAIALSASFLLSTLPCTPVLAQSSATPSEVDAIRQNLSDVELLRPLIPLALTQKQVDTLVASVKEVVTMSADVKKQDDAALKGVSDLVSKTRKDALNGTNIPADYDTKISEAQKASVARYAQARVAAIKKLLLALDSTLTPAQKDAVEAWSEKMFGGKRIPKKYQSNPSSAPKEEVQALALAALVEHSFLDERILDLLKQYKPSSDAGAAPAKQ